MSEVDIQGLAAGGNGVGRLEDGRVVFVPRTAPGDRVSIQIVDERKRWARGRVRAFSRRSTDRVDPECAHYVSDRCGGCQLQHIGIEAQRRLKGKIVGDAFRRIGHMECADPTVEPSSTNWRYRRKLSLHRDAAGRIGLHPYDDPTNVFDLKDCAITDESLMRLWRSLARCKAALPDSCDKIILTLSRDGGRHIVVRSAEPWDAAAVARLVGEQDVSFWNLRRKKRLKHVAGPQSATSPLSFEQANPDLADRIRRAVVESVDDGCGGIAWDLYGGFGDTARLLAERGYEVWTVDIDPEVGRWHGGPSGPRGVHWISGPAEEIAPRLPQPDLVVVNPPRVGLPGRLSETLERWGRERVGPRIGYISCDPATLARDIARMPAFRVTSVWAFDMFPQTYHVETAVILSGRRDQQ